MAITTSKNNNVDFLGMTADVRENILRSLVGNLKNASWAYKTKRESGEDGYYCSWENTLWQWYGLRYSLPR